MNGSHPNHPIGSCDRCATDPGINGIADPEWDYDTAAERFQAAQRRLEAAIRRADGIDPTWPATDRQAIWQAVADTGAERDAALAAVRDAGDRWDRARAELAEIVSRNPHLL